MLEKLEAIHERYLTIETQINDPDVTQDMKVYIKLSKDYKELQPIIEGYKKYKNIIFRVFNKRKNRRKINL